MNKHIFLLALCLALSLTACTKDLGEGTTASRNGFTVNIEDGRLVLSDTIHFETDSDALAPESNDFLDLIAEVLGSHSGIASVRIEGHTDAHGTAERNQDLSERRARAVVAYLAAHGVTQRLDAVGFGATRLVCADETPECDARNRRVDFFLGAD